MTQDIDFINDEINDEQGSDEIERFESVSISNENLILELGKTFLLNIILNIWINNFVTENRQEIVYKNKNVREIVLEYGQYFDDDGITIFQPKIEKSPSVKSQINEQLNFVSIPFGLF
ncbi:unnamed protein product [Brachionus calyciflorus]|uniref:Uncharacterized protein n=1 Tax=Brachionus calyciflorus TaxID=104777 RepID=A0A814B314_9BILA|nr:unnamed protein product [Brachionus calyciflorus]